MFKSCAAGLMILMAATAVSASANDEPAPVEKKKQKMICKSDGVTGSRLKSKRTCMTAEQWDELRAQTQKDIGDFTRSSGQVPIQKGPFG
jgi:hypothetical protein